MNAMIAHAMFDGIVLVTAAELDDPSDTAYVCGKTIQQVSGATEDEADYYLVTGFLREDGETRFSDVEQAVLFCLQHPEEGYERFSFVQYLSPVQVEELPDECLPPKDVLDQLGIKAVPSVESCMAQMREGAADRRQATQTMNSMLAELGYRQSPEVPTVVNLSEEDRVFLKRHLPKAVVIGDVILMSGRTLPAPQKGFLWMVGEDGTPVEVPDVG